ncbi:MAG: hypothetical protein Q7J73_10945 [Dehalococcoidales bacterium]|nr:hypothetical protein [Dehalococcoidales bacterium]
MVKKVARDTRSKELKKLQWDYFMRQLKGKPTKRLGAKILKQLASEKRN